MITRVLVPMDDSEMAERALRHAIDAYPAASITVYHVVGEPSPMMGKLASVVLEDDIHAIGQQLSAEIFESAKNIAAESDRTVETVVGYGKPAKKIVGRAEDFDVVVMGSHGGSLADRLFIGDITRTVVNRSPAPVTVVR